MPGGGWNKGYKLSAEYKDKISRALTGRTFSKEHCRNISLAKKGCSAWNKGLACPHPPGYYTPELREKRRQNLLGRKLPDYWVTAIREAQRRPEVRAKISLANLGRVVSPEGRARMSEAQRCSSTRKKHRENILQRYREGRYGKRPSAPEKALEQMLNTSFPGQFIYNGAGPISIGDTRYGACIPDFISTNGHKIVIEVFGSYWHKLGEPGKKKAWYARRKYRCLVFWDHEVQKKKEYILQKVRTSLCA